MQTERPSPRFADIDLWEPSDVLEAMIGGQFAAVAAVRAALPTIARAALEIENRLRGSGRLVYAGAGTSGRLAVQDGAELMPTFSWPRDRLLLLIAGGEEAMVRAVEGAEDEREQAAAQVSRSNLGAEDVLIAVAASGTTPFTLACLREARNRGTFTVGIANNRETPIIKDADQGIFLDTGAEPIAGLNPHECRDGPADHAQLALDPRHDPAWSRLSRDDGRCPIDQHQARETQEGDGWLSDERLR